MGIRFSDLYHHLDNSIDDGYIEKRILQDIPGYGECLMRVRKIHMAENVDGEYAEALSKAEANNEEISQTRWFLQFVLIYAKYNRDITSGIEDEITSLFYECTEYVDNAVSNYNPIERKRNVNIIFDKLIQLIYKEVEEKAEEKAAQDKNKDKSDEPSDNSEPDSDTSTQSEESSEESDDNETGDDTDNSESSESNNEKEEDNSENDSDTESDKGNASDVTDEDQAEDKSSESDNEQSKDDTSMDNHEQDDSSTDDKSPANDSKSDNSDDTDEEGSGNSSDSKEDDGQADNPDSESEKDSTSEDSDDSSSNGEDSASDEDNSDDVSEEQKEQNKDEILSKVLGELTSLSETMEDETDHSELATLKPVSELPNEEASDGHEISDNLCPPETDNGPEDWDLSYLENQVAEEMVAEDVKNQIERDMKRIADNTRKGRIDKYPSREKYLEPDNLATHTYDEQHEELDRIARRVVKNLDRIIKERQKGDKQNSLYAGKMIDAAHTYRKDKKIFANKILPEDIPDMEVVVLVDCSGSMSYSNRMEQSVKCAYVTWKFCQLMKIPCSVYGHTTNYSPENKVLINCVAHAKSMDKEDAKRIFMLRPYADNRDGWALNFCCEALAESYATTKLLLVISDGLPAADGYGFILGKKDCQEVVRKYKKKGISIITAGIDECADDIKSLYLDGVPQKEAAKFLDFTDMTQLPRAFANIIKKELL